MQTPLLQKFAAVMALILYPFPALNLGVSVTWSDLFLVAALALNAQELFRPQAFQLPMLLAWPLFLVSAMLDPEGTLESIAQIVFLWGVVMPFGWAAFTTLRPRTIVVTILAASLVSAGFAIGQSLDLIPLLENQKNVAGNLEFRRAAGLNLSCNALVMSLTPLFLVIPLVPFALLRAVCHLGLILGLVSSVSKSAILAIPGMLYAVYRDPRPVRLLQWGVLAGLAGIAYAQQKGMLEEAADRFLGSVEHRADYADDSIEHRAELIHAALEAMHECYLLGLGIEGAYERIAEDSGNAVHVYQLGIALIAGIPGASLLFWGIFIIGRRLAQQGEHEWAAFLGAHFLACTVTTVLFLSVQTYPVVIAASVLVIREREQRERQLRPQRERQKSMPPAGAPQRVPAAMRRAA